MHVVVVPSTLNYLSSWKWLLCWYAEVARLISCFTLQNIQLDEDISRLNKKVDEFRQESAQLKVKNKELEEDNKGLENGLQEIQAALKEQGNFTRNKLMVLYSVKVLCFVLG